MKKQKRGYSWLDSMEKRGYKLKLARTCYICGFSKRLQIHHVDPISNGGSPVDTNNMVMLCEECHKRIHKTSRKNVDMVKRLETLKQKWKEGDRKFR